MRKRTRTMMAQTDESTQQHPPYSVECFYRHCAKRNLQQAHGWWERYGEDQWNECSDTNQRNVAHCAVISGDLALVKRVYKDVPDLFLDSSESDLATVMHLAVMRNVSLEIFQYLCKKCCHWEDVTQDMDVLGRPAIVLAIKQYKPKGDPRLDCLIDYYARFAPQALQRNPLPLYHQTPWECAKELLDHDSESFRRMESVITQSPVSPGPSIHSPTQSSQHDDADNDEHTSSAQCDRSSPTPSDA